MIEKLLEKTTGIISKVLNISDERLMQLNAKTVDFAEKLKASTDRISSFILAKPATSYVQETFPEIVLGKKMVKNLNIQVAEMTKRMGEQHFDILTPQEKELPLKIIEAFDKARNLGEGLPISPLKYGGREMKSFSELKEFVLNNIDNLNEKQKQVIKAFKDLSDEIGMYQTNNFGEDILKLEDSLRERIKIVSSQKFVDELDELRNIFNTKTGINLSFWNMYYPHIQEWKLPYNKANVEFLKMFYPNKAKDINAMWEKQRYGLPSPYIEDPELVYKTMLFNFNWLKKYREILSNTLNSHDFFKQLTPDEIQQLIAYWRNNPQYIPFHKPLSAEKYLPKNIYEKFKKLYPNEKGFAIWHETRPFGGNLKLGDEQINDLVNILFGDDLNFKSLKSLGLEKKIYLVPETAYHEFNSWGEDIFGSKPMFNPIKDLVSMWKSSITVWTRFVPFRLNNSIGDIFALSMKQPGAITKLLDAFSIVKDILLNQEIKRPIPLIDKRKFIELLKQHGLTSTFIDYKSGVGNTIIKREDGIIGGLKYIFDFINVSAEMTPKVASILKNLERVEKGLLPDFTGAEKYILSLAKKDKDLIPAIFERGATITVDYSNIPTKYRKIMTEFVAPFSYWYVRTFDQLVSMFGTKAGLKRWTYFYAMPLALTYYWNTSNPDRKVVWDALPPYLKITPLTIIAGIDQETKKPLVLSYYTPAQMVADFLGVDNFVSGLEKVKNKEWTPKDLVINYITGATFDIPSKYVSLLNPAINGVFAIIANRDMFSKTEIVPQELIGTKYEKQIQFNYFIRQSLLSPIYPAMISVGLNYPSDFWESFYDKKDVRKAKDFISEYFNMMFDVKKGLGIVSDEKIDLFFSRAAFEEKRRLEAKRNEILEDLYQDYVKTNLHNDGLAQKRFFEKLNKIADGEYDYLSMTDVENYFNRSSVLRRLISDASRLKDDKDKYLKTKVLLNYLHQAEMIEKTAPKSIRDELTEFLNDLYN